MKSRWKGSCYRSQKSLLILYTVGYPLNQFFVKIIGNAYKLKQCDFCTLFLYFVILYRGMEGFSVFIIHLYYNEPFVLIFLHQTKKTAITGKNILWVPASYTLQECAQYLKQYGLRLICTPEAKTITVGGALATGAHGGGYEYGTFASICKNDKSPIHFGEKFIAYAELQCSKAENVQTSRTLSSLPKT